MNDHFQWLDEIECKFSGRVVDLKEETNRKLPNALSLGKLGKGQSFHQVKNQTRRGDCTC